MDGVKDIRGVGGQGLKNGAACQGIFKAPEIGVPCGVVGGQLGEGDDGLYDGDGRGAVGVVLAGGAALNADEPTLKAGVRGKLGYEGFLNVGGPPAVSQAVTVSTGRPGSGAASSSGHGVVTSFGIIVQ